MALPRAPRGVILVVLITLAAAVASAGCVKKDPPPTDTTTTTPTGTTSGTPTTPTGNSTPTPIAKPTVTPVTAKGAIQGPFDGSWKINVPQISPLAMKVNFNLTGAQPGAPPTAVVYLTLSGPDAKAIKTATIGLGQAANNVAWTLGPEVAAAADYTLKATTQPAPAPGAPTGLPSGGVANYDLLMSVDY